MSRVSGQVRVVGAGLLGTSIGLALSKLGVDVIMSDTSRASQALAVDYGAGRQPQDSDSPALVVVCVPPDHTAEVVEAEAVRQRATPTAIASNLSGSFPNYRSSLVAALAKWDADWDLT